MTTMRDVQTWPAYTHARHQLSRMQDITGRVCTAAGGAVAAAGMLVPGVAAPGLAAAAACTAAGLVTLRAWRPDGVTRATASGMYALPGAGLSVLLGWEALADAPHWGMAAGLLVWVTGTWVVRPAWAARRMLAGPVPEPPVPPQRVAEVEAAAEHPVARWWAEHVAVDGGPAPGTVLREVEPYGAGVRAVIASERPGTAVPDISIAALSALLDVPEDLIRIGPVPGRGAGVRMLTVGDAPEDDDATRTAAEAWRKDIAPKAMPGSYLAQVRHGTGEQAGVVELHAEMPRAGKISYDLESLVSALDAEDDPTRIAVESSVRRAIVTVYPRNPLSEMRAVRREDLVMDAKGYITIGRHHNGRPAKRRLFDPETGSAQRFVLFGTTGAGKSRTLQLQLIAEKVNGICTWLADLKEGQSVPEAAGQVDWRVTSQQGAIVMLRAAVAAAEDRMRRYAAAGRNSFALGGDPLIHVHVEEANRLLERGAPYRDEATRLLKELGRTGRSVGVGAGIAAQAGHLDELGGSDTLRGMLKEGEVTLLRWSSSMMRQLTADGLLPPHVQLAPIPKRIGAQVLTSQFDETGDDEEAGEGTQGMAYLLSGPNPASVMRHFRVGSIAPLPGLDPEILALYGPEPPVSLGPEDAAAAGAAYAVRGDEAAVAALLDAEAAPGTVPSTVDDDEESARPRPVLLEDRVAAALEAAEGPLSVDAVLEAVNAGGGKAVRVGSIRNALSGLAEAGRAVRVDRGVYQAAR